MYLLQSNSNHEYLGDGTNAIPEFPDIELPAGYSLPEDCSIEDVDTFRSIYREHCEVNLCLLPQLYSRFKNK